MISLRFAFAEVLGRIAEFAAACPTTHVLLAPSPRDVIAAPVFPTPPLARPAGGSLPDNVSMLPNPATFKIGEVHILMHMCGHARTSSMHTQMHSCSWYIRMAAMHRRAHNSCWRAIGTADASVGVVRQLRQRHSQDLPGLAAWHMNKCHASQLVVQDQIRRQFPSNRQVVVGVVTTDVMKAMATNEVARQPVGGDRMGAIASQVLTQRRCILGSNSISSSMYI